MNKNKAKTIIEKALNNLIDSVEQEQSKALQEYLSVMSRFHQYSFQNIMLIASQKPEATKVAGFHAWRKLGRWVKKNEKGIAIIAPLILKKEVNKEEESLNEELFGFKVVYVFDIGQTDGGELPSFAVAQGDPQIYTRKLEEYIDELHIELNYEEGMQMQGYSVGGKIVIKKCLSSAEDFSVKVHELAHELLHHIPNEKLCKKVMECEAEAIAFVVSKAIGLDTNTAFKDYIQLYKGNKEILVKSLHRIQNTSHTILSKLFD